MKIASRLLAGVMIVALVGPAHANPYFRYGTTGASSIPGGGTNQPPEEDDVIPDPFSIDDLAGVSMSTVIQSSPVPVTGFVGSLPISVSGGGGAEISVGGGSWGATASISAGQSFSVRLASSATYVTTVTAMVDIGGVTGEWNVTTRGQDTIPDAFTIPESVGNNPITSPTVSSDLITPTGFEGTLTITASGSGEITAGNLETGDIRGPAKSTTISPGEVFVVTIPIPDYGSTFSSDVTIGDAAPVTFIVRTVPSDTMPDAFSIPPKVGIAPSTIVSSEFVSINNVMGPVTVSADNGAEVSVDGRGTWAPSLTVQAYRSFSLAVRMTSSSSLATSVTTNVTVGDAAPVPYTVTTHP